MQKLVDLFTTLVSIDSPSSEEASIGKYLEQALVGASLTVEHDKANNLYGYLAGEGPTILLNAHMDTVELARGARVVQENGILKTNGSTALGADDKAALAAILTSLYTIKDKKLPHPNLVVLITTCEEQGLVGAKQIDLTKLSGIDYGFTFDASKPIGLAITRAPASDKLEVTFHGRGAHAGFKPESGISAIQMGALAVSTMPLLRIDEETTANVGSFIAPGARNIVCDTAHLVFEARSLNDSKLRKQIETMQEALRKAADHYHGTVDIVQSHLYKGYSHQSDGPVLKAFQNACNTLGIPYREESTNGGSDANILNNLGISTLVCSTGYEEAHTKEEYIPVKELENLARLVLELSTL